MAISSQVHQMTLNRKHFEVKCTPYVYRVIQIPTSPKFHSVLLYGQPFSSYRPFWHKFTKAPPPSQNDTEH